MTMRYTAEATMDEPAMRDLDRWKDKIEVRLDNRQVFFLFFGSALVACLLFVLGVIVGKRLEARGRAEAPQVDDPLAMLDRVAATTPTTGESDEGLTFPKALLGGKKADVRAPKGKGGKAAAEIARVDVKVETKADVESAAGAKSKPEASEPRAANDGKAAGAGATTAAKVTAGTAPAEGGKQAAASVPAAGPKANAVVAPGGVKQAAAKSPAAAGALLAAASPAPASVGAQAKTVAPTLRPSPVPVQTAAEASRSRGRFTLQLSSFPDRAEAEAFARKFTGQSPYILPTEIPGKGTWYRVRVGDFASAKEAIDAKGAFEHKFSVIAYVAGR